MFKRLEKLHPFFTTRTWKIVSNKYIVLSLSALVWLLFFDQNSYLAHQKLNKEMEEIYKDIEYYKLQIEKDKKTLKNLGSKNTFERIAREQYFMKRPKEEVFILEKNKMSYIEDFSYYLQLEKALSQNSIQAYRSDLQKLENYLKAFEMSSIEKLSIEDVRSFLYTQSEVMSKRSIVRMISTFKSFYDYLLMEEVIEVSPMDRIDSPKITKKIPEFLELEEVNKMIESVDMSDPHFFRNTAILEMLYSCGLRVSELCDLNLNRVFLEEGFIQIIGKGNKERMVPLSEILKESIEMYLEKERDIMVNKKECSDHLFLNNRGKRISRIMVFNIVKKQAKKIGIQRNVSPHSFRHSFASHMVENGADLRMVQDLLGHESILTTELYSHLNNQFIKNDILSKHPRASK